VCMCVCARACVCLYACRRWQLSIGSSYSTVRIGLAPALPATGSVIELQAYKCGSLSHKLFTHTHTHSHRPQLRPVCHWLRPRAPGPKIRQPEPQAVYNNTHTNANTHTHTRTGLNSALSATGSALELQAHKSGSLSHKLQQTVADVGRLRAMLYGEGPGGSASATAAAAARGADGGAGGGSSVSVCVQA